MKAEEIKELAKLFDSKLTKHPVSSEELQSVLTDFGTILIVNLTTTQPQPSMSAEEILDDELSVSMAEYLKENPIFKEWIKDAMYKYAAQLQPTPFTPPRSEQEEADRLVKLQFPISCYKECISMLQLRGLSTEFEEKVLTILKGR